MTLPPVQSNAPTYVEVTYRTLYGLHVAEYKMREWIAGSDLGSVPRWSDDAPVGVLEMLTDLLTLLAATLDESANFSLARLFTKATPTSPAIIRKVVGLDIDGSSAASGWFKAVQLNMNGKDTAGKDVRLVMLDALTGNNFEKLYTGEISAPVLAAWAEFSDDTNGWASAAGNRPDAIISQTATLNERLRREYHLT